MPYVYLPGLWFFRDGDGGEWTPHPDFSIDIFKEVKARRITKSVMKKNKGAEEEKDIPEGKAIKKKVKKVVKEHNEIQEGAEVQKTKEELMQELMVSAAAEVDDMRRLLHDETAAAVAPEGISKEK